MAPNFKKKRKCENEMVDSDSENESQEATRRATPNAWTRYLVVEGADKEKPLSKLSPFVIQKYFEGVSSDGFEIKRLRNGSYLVKCKTRTASNQLLKRDGERCVDRPIKVSAHRGLNSCRGVIRCARLQDLSENEIKVGLQEQGVSEVHRVHIRKDGKRVPTNTLFLTFLLPKLPEYLIVEFERVKVTLFVPTPLRCFKCQKFGHPAKACKNAKTVCHKCGETEHDGVCQTGLKCVNCTENHPASSKDCPVFKKEQAIQQIRAERGVSFPEARRLFEQNNPSAQTGRSYSAVVKKGTKAIEVQTELTWVKGEKPSPLPRVSGASGAAPPKRVSAGTQASQLPGSHAQATKSSSPSSSIHLSSSPSFAFTSSKPPPSLSPSPSASRSSPSSSSTSSRPLPDHTSSSHGPSERSISSGSKGSEKPDRSKGGGASFATPPTSPQKSPSKKKKVDKYKKKSGTMREQKGDNGIELKNSYSLLEEEMEN